MCLSTKKGITQNPRENDQGLSVRINLVIMLEEQKTDREDQSHRRIQKCPKLSNLRHLLRNKS